MGAPSQLAPKAPAAFGSRLLSSRTGTFALAGLAGLAGLAAVLAFMSNYRETLRGGPGALQVLVADRTIDKGTPGDVVAESSMFRTVEVGGDEAHEGALTDPSALAGTAASRTVYEGQQLTSAAFAAKTDPVIGKLEGTDRALSLPVDAARGNIGQIEPGSRVDVLGFNEEGAAGKTGPVLDVLARDALVLKAPVEGGSESAGSSSSRQPVVLRLSDVEAARVAFGANLGDVWLTLRPPTVAKDSSIKPIRVGSLLGLGILEG